METRHVCRSKSPNTHLCSNDLSKKWTLVALMRVCLQIDWIIRQRHVHRKGIPTSMLNYVYTSQSLRAIQFPLEPIRAGVQNRHSGRWRTYERYARGPCNRLAPGWLQEGIPKSELLHHCRGVRGRKKRDNLLVIAVTPAMLKASQCDNTFGHQQSGNKVICHLWHASMLFRFWMDKGKGGHAKTMRKGKIHDIIRSMIFFVKTQHCFLKN